MKISQKLSDWIRAVSFFAALLIVPIHASFLGRVEMSSVEYWTMTIISDGICRVAVPWFFVVSGFFLALSYKNYGVLLKKRFQSLYVPFVIWNIIYFGFQLVNGKGFGNLTERIFGWHPVVDVACMQFWYLKTLFVMILLAPVILFMVRKAWWAVLALCFAGWITNDFGLAFPQALRLFNFFFIVLGIALGYHVGLVEKLVAYLPDAPRCLMPFVGFSFFLYAIHFIFINILSKVLTVVYLPLLVQYFAKIIVATTLSLATAAILKRFVPKWYGLLVGGR